MGVPAPGQFFGFALDRGWLLEGVGGIYLGVDGRWWISFKRCPGVAKVKTAHACAKRLLAEAKERGITVHGMAQPGIDGATTWLKRLGFVETDENLGGLTVWQKRPS